MTLSFYTSIHSWHNSTGGKEISILRVFASMDIVLLILKTWIRYNTDIFYSQRRISPPTQMQQNLYLWELLFCPSMCCATICFQISVAGTIWNIVFGTLFFFSHLAKCTVKRQCNVVVRNARGGLCLFWRQTATVKAIKLIKATFLKKEELFTMYQNPSKQWCVPGISWHQYPPKIFMINANYIFKAFLRA